MATILVAEDDADISVLLRILLEDEGHEVEVVSDGAAALAGFRSRPADLVVLDISLRGDLDGLDVLRTLRGDQPDPRPRVLLLSARASDDDVQRGLDAGADAYVVKPFDATELIVRVGALVDGSAGA